MAVNQKPQEAAYIRSYPVAMVFISVATLMVSHKSCIGSVHVQHCVCFLLGWS